MLAWTIGIVGAFVGTCLWLGLPGRVGIIVGYGTAGIMVGTMLCYCLFKWIQQDYVGYQILIVIFTVGLFWLILLVFCRANFEL